MSKKKNESAKDFRGTLNRMLAEVERQAKRAKRAIVEVKDDDVAQGDVLFRKVKSIPKGLKRLLPDDNNNLVVAHSETGHHHVIANAPNVVAYMTDDPAKSFVAVKKGTSVDVVHLRAWNTHETLRLLNDEDKGEAFYELRRQKEQTPEGLRIVAD